MCLRGPLNGETETVSSGQSERRARQFSGVQMIDTGPTQATVSPAWRPRYIQGRLVGRSEKAYSATRVLVEMVSWPFVVLRSMVLKVP